MYGLYGRLCGTLEISLPTLGYNYAILGYTILSIIICSTNTKSIHRTPISLTLFATVGLISTLINLGGENFINSFCCVLVPLLSYQIGTIITIKNNNELDGRNLKPLYYGLSLLLLICFIQYKASPVNLILHRDFTFQLIFLVPFLFILKNKKISFGFQLLTFILLAISLKRSILIAYIFTIVLFYTMLLYLNKKIKLSKIIFTATCVIFLLAFVFISFESAPIVELLTDRFSSIEEDGGSGRDNIYMNVFEKISNSDFTLFLLGHGYDTVQANTGIPAHNELLEIAYDFGIILMFIWIILLFQLSKNGLRQISLNNYRTGCLQIVTLIFWQLITETNNVFVSPEYQALVFLSFGIFNKKKTY